MMQTDHFWKVGFLLEVLQKARQGVAEHVQKNTVCFSTAPGKYMLREYTTPARLSFYSSYSIFFRRPGYDQFPTVAYRCLNSSVVYINCILSMLDFFHVELGAFTEAGSALLDFTSETEVHTIIAVNSYYYTK